MTNAVVMTIVIVANTANAKQIMSVETQSATIKIAIVHQKTIVDVMTANHASVAKKRKRVRKQIIKRHNKNCVFFICYIFTFDKV